MTGSPNFDGQGPNLSMIPTTGIATRENGLVVVRLKGNSGIAGAENTICLNPEDNEADRVYEKRFLNEDKIIWLPGEEQGLVDFLCRTPISTTLGLTGYTSLKDDFCKQYGFKADDYEEICSRLFSFVNEFIAEKLPEVTRITTHGASELCIDKVARRMSKELRMLQVGFNQPEWMFWVPDDAVPVVCAADKNDYHITFSKYTDILICVGGRNDALRHDLPNGIRHDKLLLPCPLLKFICDPKKGPPPARDDAGNVQDASRAIFQSLPQLAYLDKIKSFDKLAKHVAELAVNHLKRVLLNSGDDYIDLSACSFGT